MTCCISSCRNVQRLLPPDSKITFHRLPQGEFFETFKNTIDQQDLQWSKRRCICSEHYEDRDFIKGKKLFLKKTAVPSRNLGASQISHEYIVSTPSVSFGESISMNSKQEIREPIRAESPLSTLSEDSISSETIRKRLSFIQALHSYSKSSKIEKDNVWKKWYNSAEYEPGFSLMCFNILKKISEITDTKLICTLICDEMTIAKKLEFNGKQIWGCGTPRLVNEADEVEAATEVFVLIVVCHTELWKLPIGYFFTKPLDKQDKGDIIKQALIRLNKVKIDITSVTCDGTAVNFAMFQELGCDWSHLRNIKSYFLHPSTGENVYAIFDVYHLQKLIRNNFACLKIIIDEKGQRIEWKFIEHLHVIQEQEQKSLSSGNKLKFVQSFWKTQESQVNLDAKTLEEGIADSLELLQTNQNNKYFQNCEGTIRFIRIINQLIGLLNSRNQFGKENILSFRTGNEETWNTFLVEAKKYLLLLTDINGILLSQTRMKISFLGFAVTIQSTIDIFNDYVQSNRLNYFLTYKMSMSHLEKIFSSIRAHCRGNNPTCLQFYHCYKKILSSGKMPGACDSNWVLNE